MDAYTALRIADDLSSRMFDALHGYASNPQGSTARRNNGNGGGTHGALVRRGLVALGVNERGESGYFLTPTAWAFLRAQYGIERPADPGRLTLDQALAEAYPAEAPAPAAPRAGEVVIPGALADHLTAEPPADADTRATLDAARRGRGRSLIIKPETVAVLHTISRAAEHLLDSPGTTRAQRTAARAWLDRAGHAPTPASEPAPVPGALVDPWTWIRRPSSIDAAQAAEERAERRQQLANSRGANAYPVAAAAVRAVVREMPKGGVLRVPVVDGAPEVTLTRDDLHALAYSGHTTADAVARVRAAVAAHIRHGEREVHIMFPALGMRPTLYLPDVMALLNRWDDDQAEVEKFKRATRAVDAVEHAEQVGARVATVDDAEALYAAALVTEAEATDGTWRGEWIGEQQADDALFVVERPADQGALFDDRATAPAPTVREQRLAALDRIRAKADAERAEHRTTTDDQIAAECAAHGVPAPRTVAARIAARTAEQAPARRVIEGVVVSHGGTAQGSKPKDATNPDVIAARKALAGLAVATLTDHHDVTEPTEDERDTRGYFIDPRTHGRVAVYWLEGGRIVRRDDPAHGAALDCLADRLKHRGWAVEKMLRSSQCVFAHRPSTD